MPAIAKGKTDQLKDDLTAAKKLKPKLRKFVIDAQVDAAAASAKERKDEQEAILKEDGVIRTAEKLAYIAFLDKKLWKAYPPYFEMRWLSEGWATPDLQREMTTDMAGFALYLTREYQTYLRERSTSKRGYPSPMQPANLLFFWQKFNADLRLLIEADRRRMALGNAGVVIVGDGTTKN